MQQDKYSYNHVIDGLEHVVLVLDLAGHIKALNKTALNIFKKYSDDDYLGVCVWNLPWWKDASFSHKKWQLACNEATRGERVKLEDEIEFSRYTVTLAKFSLAPLKDEAGQVVGLLAELQNSLASLVESGISYRLMVEAQQRETRLLEAEKRFRLMVESIEDYGMFMVDLEGFITSWNRGAERLTGYSETEAVGRHFSMLYPGTLMDKSHADHELAMAQRYGRYEDEGVRMRKNGTQYQAQITLWRVDDNEGRTIGYAKITRDITALKEAQRRESQLFESENRFRLMVESIQDYAMFMVDQNGIITSWNRGAERLTGYTEPEAVGQSFSILYPKGGLTEGHAVFELAMARQNGRYEEEGVRVRRDGSTYHALINVWPVEDKTGQIIGFAKITRDITERKRTEQALKNSEAKFRTITDAMPQMVWSALPDGRQDYINQQWFLFTGVSAAVTRADGWLELVHPDDRIGVDQSWRRAIATGDSYEAQFRLHHISNTYRWTLARALPVRNEEGEIIRWMGTLTDIHEQKRAEAELQESARRKDEFLAMLAHELRNPLAPIRNSTLLIQRLAEPDGAVKGALDVIERQVNHMTRLIDDLLDVARISRGKIELRRESFEFGELIRDTANDFQSDFDNKQVQLNLELPDVPLWLFADRTRIAQAIGNLLHNALKFTEVNGRVSVTLTSDEINGKPFGTLRVADTGVGIEPGLLDQLFAPFIQGNQGLARSQGGLGLGLALIKGFVVLHGGKVHAFSAGLGCGAEFVVQLPLVASLANSPEVPAMSFIKRLKIVLIDDNQDMVATLAALLEMEGHRVLTAFEGDSGIALIAAEKPDLVFCDIGLPGDKDGYAVARLLRSQPALASTYIVALSGYGQEKDKRLALEAGFNEHLLKPVDFKSLAEIIAVASQAPGTSPVSHKTQGTSNQ